MEASDICDHAELVVAHNGLSERVTVIQSKAEDLELPEMVDLIVSEWMGTMLLVGRVGHFSHIKCIPTLACICYWSASEPL